jgi:hypothetical protein
MASFSLFTGSMTAADAENDGSRVSERAVSVMRGSVVRGSANTRMGLIMVILQIKFRVLEHRAEAEKFKPSHVMSSQQLMHLGLIQNESVKEL